MFFETFLPKVLGFDTDHGKVKLNRAHWMGLPRDDNKPCAVVMKLHDFSDRERILAAARAKQPLTYDGAPFHIGPDFSAVVVQQRRYFNGVCSLLIQ